MAPLGKFDGLGLTASEIVTARKRDVLAVLAGSELPITLRNVYYQLLSNYGWDKTGAAYQQLSRDMKALRLDGTVPFAAIIDATRAPVGYTTDTNLEPVEAVARQVADIRAVTSVWDEIGKRPQLWVESRSAGGNLFSVCREFEVSLWQTGGQSSLTLLWDGAGDKPTDIGLMVDRDKSGLDIAKTVVKRLAQFHPEGPLRSIKFLAVTREQIEEWDLEAHYDKHGTPKWELESITADRMRSIARNWFLSLLPDGVWDDYLNRKADNETEVRTITDRILDDLGYSRQEGETDDE